MSLENIRSKVQGTIMEGGRALLHAQYPDDFEYYACTFMLENGSGDVVKIFNFPVMPNSIQIQKQPLVNIKKTARGYVDQFSTSFSGEIISLNGTFGRKFRLLLLGGEEKSSKSPEESEFKKNSFDAKIKTGYGALNLMEKIIHFSTKLDENKLPYKLFFINYTFNQYSWVEVVDWSKQQSLENNMMWNYSLQMKVLADAKEKFNNSEDKKMKISNLLKVATVQKMLNETINNLTVGGAVNIPKRGL